MSRYHQQFRTLRCAHCYKTKTRNSGDEDRGNRIKTLSQHGESVKCRCLDCGKVTMKNSIVARRIFKREHSDAVAAQSGTGEVSGR